MTKTNIRIVGRRRFRETDPLDPNVTVGFDDDGMFACETREISGDDSAAINAEIAKRRAVAEDLVDKLTPAQFVVYKSMKAAFALRHAEISKRLNGDPTNLLVGVQVPSKDWYRWGASAFDAVVAEIVADEIRVEQRTTSCIPERDRFENTYEIRANTLLREVKNMHVVAMYFEEKSIPEELRPFFDTTIDVRNMPKEFFEEAIEREFDEPDEAGWPNYMDLSSVDPDLLDAVCSRAACASDVVPKLLAIAAASDRKKRKEKATDEKPKSTSTASSRAIYAPEILRPTSPTLDDLHGYGAAQA